MKPKGSALETGQVDLEIEKIFFPYLQITWHIKLRGEKGTVLFLKEMRAPADNTRLAFSPSGNTKSDGTSSIQNVRRSLHV